MASMSRTLSAWVHGLSYEDLPPEVVDRAKGVTLQALTSALVGQQFDDAKDALAMMREEDGGAEVCTVLGSGAKLSRAGAALVNAETIFAGGKWDTFRMLTHPSCAILPAALVASEITETSGKDFITGIVAGYEVMERLAADFIPTIMSRGFHAGPVFGIFGAAITLAKMTGLNEEQIHSTIAQCVNLASGNVEGVRSGGKVLREGAAVRNAMLAVAMARHGATGSDSVLEGEAGFYYTFIGNNRGDLRYSFTADNRADLNAITANLGQDWMFLETVYRIYSTAGYNIAHVDVTAALCAEHGIRYEDVDRIHSVVNWLETEYPSPAFPSRSGQPAVNSPHYYAAPEVLKLRQRVTIPPSHRHPLFGPSVTIHMKNRKSVTKHGTGREFLFDFDGLVNRIAGIAPSLPVTGTQYDELIETCRNLDNLDQAENLIPLAVIP